MMIKNKLGARAFLGSESEKEYWQILDSASLNSKPDFQV